MNAASLSAAQERVKDCLFPGTAASPCPVQQSGDLLASRAQIASALGFRTWRDSRIKDLIALGCPIFRLPGYRRGGWRADPLALSMWMRRQQASGPRAGDELSAPVASAACPCADTSALPESPAFALSA